MSAAMDLTGAPRAPVFRHAFCANPGLWVPLTLSGFGWACLVYASFQPAGIDLCISRASTASAQVWAAFGAEWALRGSSMLLAWVMMVLAMMMPIAATHMSVAIARTAPAYKLHVLAGALGGYLGVWLVFGALYLALFALALTAQSLNLGWVGTLCFFALAIGWCAAPMRARALRAAHAVPLFYGGGASHFWAGLRWGIRLAGLCAITCFAVMSAPMLSGQGLMGMILVTHVLLTERHKLRPERRLVALPLALLGAAGLAGVG